MVLTPTQFFLQWLGDRPLDARVAVAVDSDRLIADAGLLGKPTLVDGTGRSWQVVVYCGDDLAFRIRFRKAASADHILVVLARGTHPSGTIDGSYITDILARNEAGPPLNLSVPAFFGRLCPKINFPGAEIRRYKDALLDRLDNVPKATAKIIERWGRPDDWGRGQVAALVLLAHHPDMTLKELWPDETDLGEFLIHILRLLIGHPPLSKQRGILNEMIEDAARPQVKEHLYWLKMPLEQITAYLVRRDAPHLLNLLRKTEVWNGGASLVSRDWTAPRYQWGTHSLLSPSGLGQQVSAGITGRRGRRERVRMNAIRAIRPYRHVGLWVFDEGQPPAWRVVRDQGRRHPEARLAGKRMTSWTGWRPGSPGPRPASRPCSVPCPSRVPTWSASGNGIMGDAALSVEYC